MLLVIDGKVTQHYRKPETGVTYFVVADADTLTALELSSQNLLESDVKPYLDVLGRCEMRVKVTKFQNQARFEVLGFKFTPVTEARKSA